MLVKLILVNSECISPCNIVYFARNNTQIMVSCTNSCSFRNEINCCPHTVQNALISGQIIPLLFHCL